MRYLTFLLVCSTFAVAGETTFRAKLRHSPEGKYEILERGFVPSKNQGYVEQAYPEHIEEHRRLGASRILEIRGNKEEVITRLTELKAVLQKGPNQRARFIRDEVRTLVDNGDSANRIDLVFMGDGYTEAEKGKFFADAKRLTDEMFQGDTFHSYLPIFNVHAVFRASKESGIGKNSQPKDTAYGLYRPGDTLRAIMPTNKSAARASCAQAPDCDYPIIMANDPYYGGLGGEFAITTSSKNSGTKVLRHELGHNFGRVGEEYDGGAVFGANNSSSLSRLTWDHWLSGPKRAEPAEALFLDWPWHHLKGGEFSATVTSSGNAAFFEVQYGASGIETDGTLEMGLGSHNIPTPGNGHSDREFHEFLHEGGLAKGDHRFVVREKVRDGNNWLSDLSIYEYGSDYNFNSDNVSAYPVFDHFGFRSYRATHESCLMRNMKSVHFCPVCQENNWLQFFARISIIDGVKVTEPVSGRVRVEVRVPPLAHLRPTKISGEKLNVRWLRDGKTVGQLANKLSWELSEEDAEGDWEVEVKFVTPEVRKDDRNLLEASEAFRI